MSVMSDTMWHLTVFYTGMQAWNPTNLHSVTRQDHNMVRSF